MELKVAKLNKAILFNERRNDYVDKLKPFKYNIYPHLLLSS